MKINVIRNGGSVGSILSLNGGSMNGPLMLYRHPLLPLEASTKQYADNGAISLDAGNFTTGTLAVARLPALAGDVTSIAGSNNVYLSEIITAGEYTKVTVDNKGRITAGGNLLESDVPPLDWDRIISDKPTTAAGYGITDGINLSGATMTGGLTLHTDPIIESNLVTKQYADELINGTINGGPGDIVRKPYQNVPIGFLRCNGAYLDKTTYADLYAVIGDTFNNNLMPGSGQPWRQQYQINDTQTADITGWTTGTAILSGMHESQAIVTKNRVYMLAGRDETNVIQRVYSAVINSDGTLGTWTEQTALPTSAVGAQAIVTKNRVYLLGTNYSGNIYDRGVLTAPINADGTLGAWSANAPLPSIIAWSQAIVTKNRVYLLGGQDGAAAQISTVYTAVINADGTLGTWTTGTSLPVPLRYSQAIVTKNRVYLLGGSSGSAYVSTVYTAPINADGTLGTWTTGTSLPGALGYSSAIVTKNRVYLLGGILASSYSGAIYSAPINADGTLGTWAAAGSLPGALALSQAIVTKNRVHMIGGYGGTAFLSTVYTAPILGSLNDYSPYYDGTITSGIDPTLFSLPDLTTIDTDGTFHYIKY